MSIWQRPISLEDLNGRWAAELADTMGLVVTAIRDDGLTAVLPVKRENQQPQGVLHGGITCYVAESLASVASNFCISGHGVAVGMAVTASHVRAVRDGNARIEVTLKHCGRRTHVWAYELHDASNRLASFGTVTTAVMLPPS